MRMIRKARSAVRAGTYNLDGIAVAGASFVASTAENIISKFQLGVLILTRAGVLENSATFGILKKQINSAALHGLSSLPGCRVSKIGRGLGVVI